MIHKDEMGRVLPNCPSDGLERRTIAGWNEVRGDRLLVVDPDGFDRSDPDLYSRLFTEAEWREGALRSTCRFGAGFFGGTNA